MAKELKVPYLGLNIAFPWRTRLVVTPQEAEALLEILNKTPVIQTDYMENPKLLSWNEEGSDGPKIHFELLPEDVVAEAKMNSLLKT